MSSSTTLSRRHPPVATVRAPPARPGSIRSTFRTDVQALRAVAVVAVVTYHLFPVHLPGGFVGVDVFFVISGYLITQHLYAEVDRTGRVDLTRFWARRIRRLLPAALTVLGVSAVLVLTVMPRLSWTANLQEITASAAYVQNWLLGVHAVDYLAAQNTPTVAQHYWSLSVEEQFYLVWPVLLLVAAVVARRSARWSARQLTQVVLVLAAVASFAVSVWFTADRPALAFFATPARAWEFAAGGLLSLRPARPGRASPARGAALGWTGLAVVAASTLLITGATPFPGWVAAVPVAGALLVLAGDDAPTVRWSTARFTRSRGVQWLGHHSYALYLWHWPLIVVAPWALHHPLGTGSRLGIVVVSLLLAHLTVRFVEDPVRASARWRRRRWPAYAFAAAGLAVLLALSGTVIHQVRGTNAVQAAEALQRVASGAPCYGAAALVDAASCPQPFGRPAGLDLAFAASDIDAETRPCQQDDGVSTLTLCTFGDRVSPTKTIVLVGNSHALRLVPALELYGRQHGWQIILAAKTDCMGLVTTGSGPTASCLAWSSKLQQHLLAMPRLDGVIFASHASAQDYLAGPSATPAQVSAASSEVVSTWSTLRRHGVPVIVTEDVPGMRPESGPECLAASPVGYDPCALPRSSVVVPNLMTELAQQNRDLVSYVPLSPYFCDAELCHALVGGVVVYTDSHHLTATMARTMARFLGPQIAADLR